jgi:hypothetical protein
MAHFDVEISRRVATAAAALGEARADGDVFLESVHLGELAELHRIAEAHGVVLAPYEVDRPAEGAAAVELAC